MKCICTGSWISNKEKKKWPHQHFNDAINNVVLIDFFFVCFPRGVLNLAPNAEESASSSLSLSLCGQSASLAVK